MMSDKCPLCDHDMTYDFFLGHDKDGKPGTEARKHEVNGVECLKRQLAADQADMSYCLLYKGRCPNTDVRDRIEALKSELAAAQAVIYKMPKTTDGILFSDGLEVWFFDRRLACSLGGWVKQSSWDGDVLVNGRLYFNGYQWLIDKDTDHNDEVCKPKGAEQTDRALPFIYSGDAIRRKELFADRSKAKTPT